jgi:4-phytase/acid phosphatase
MPILVEHPAMKNDSIVYPPLRFCALALCAAVSIAALAQKKESQPVGKLKFVVIVSRHGVRSPTGTVEQLNQYATQPWPKWDVDPGYLTARGAKLMTLFGAYYRLYYAWQGLFASTGCGDAPRVSFYADSDERTVDTGKAIALGMFPGCAGEQQPAFHALAEGEADPLFHPIAAGVGKPDRERATDSIAGRIGDNPRGLTEAYRAPLEDLQRILLGCAPASPCASSEHFVAKRLLEIPSSLDSGKGDHLAELKGPLNTAATITENFLLEYTDGMPLNQVGWGLVDRATLNELLELHTAASDLTRRSSYLATAQASDVMFHIEKTMEQAVGGHAVEGALGKPGDHAVILVGHDTNLSNIAGMLNIDWLVDRRRDDTPPGGALVFELWQNLAAAYEVRVFYTAQTLEQMRNLTPLAPGTLPDRASIFLPDCSGAAPGFPCDWRVFQQRMSQLIDPAFVK